MHCTKPNGPFRHTCILNIGSISLFQYFYISTLKRTTSYMILQQVLLWLQTAPGLCAQKILCGLRPHAILHRTMTSHKLKSFVSSLVAVVVRME